MVEEAEGLVAEVEELYSNGDVTECGHKLRQLQALLRTVDRRRLEEGVVWGLCGVVRGEAAKLREEAPHPRPATLTLLATTLGCLRNTFPHCPTTQLLVAESWELLQPVISCTSWVFSPPGPPTPPDNSDEQQEESQDKGEQEEEEWLAAHSTLASACATCLGNLVAANSRTRHLLWPHLQPLLLHLLSYRESAVSQQAAMTLHNCLLEEGLREELAAGENVVGVVGALLQLYFTSTSAASASSAACFVLFCLELLLTTAGVVERVWPSLRPTLRLLTLDLLASCLSPAPHRSVRHLPAPTVSFLSTTYKRESDKILCSQTGQLDPPQAQVVTRLLQVLCGLAAAEESRPLLQSDPALLTTTLYLLRCLAEVARAGDGGQLGSSLVGLSVEELAAAEQHPAFGFKCDLMRLLASLTHQHPHNQDQARQLGGLPLVLELSRTDARDPLVKEAAVFALRCLLQDNPENQHAVASLQMVAVAPNPALDQLGLQVVQEGHSIRLVQAPPQPPP